jgi:hypothetical protein
LDTVKRGVRASKAAYHGQMMIYCAYMELENFLFTAINKDTAELYHELVPFDPARAQTLSDRAVEILGALEAGDLPPRLAGNPTDICMKMCDFQKGCWRHA